MEQNEQLDSPTPAPSALQYWLNEVEAMLNVIVHCRNPAPCQFCQTMSKRFLKNITARVLAGVVPHRRQQDETKDDLSRVDGERLSEGQELPRKPPTGHQ